MNQKIEIKKIKVNNGAELIAKAKEYKNSGGEWKLLEKYTWFPTGRENGEGELGWGIIISDGEKTIDIFSNKHNLSKPNNTNDEINARSELHSIFPEAKPALFDFEKPDASTFKLVKEANGKEYNLYRYLVAQDFRHLRFIIKDYFEKNEARVVNSNNRDFSGWAEIIDGQDGNTYLYIGEKNASGGREIKIGISKSEFEKGENYLDGSKHSLKQDWGLLIFSSTMSDKTPTDKENYYQTLEKTFQDQWPHREKLCRKYWEILCGKMEEKANYWNEKTKLEQYNDKKGNKEFLLARAHANEIKSELSENTKIKNCCDKECPHYLPIKDSPRHNPNPDSPKLGSKNNLISQTDKNQLLQFFLTYKITKITLDNGKLVVEYSNPSSQKIDNSELEKYKSLIQNQPNHSVSLNDLQKDKQDNGNPTKIPKDNKLILGLALGAGAVALVGVVVYFWNRKKKRA